MSEIAQILTVPGKPVTITITLTITIDQDGKVTATSSATSLPSTPAHVVNGHLIKFECKRWFDKVSVKEAHACKGCSIGCLLKECFTGKIEIPMEA